MDVVLDNDEEQKSEEDQKDFNIFEGSQINLNQSIIPQKFRNSLKSGEDFEENPFSKRQQNQHEIYTLLEGIKKILKFFLKFIPLTGQWVPNTVAIKGSGVGFFFKDVLLHFSSSQLEYKSFTEFQETCFVRFLKEFNQLNFI